MISTRETDQRLVERVQKGDQHAFDLLVKKYQHKIIALVGRYVQDQHEMQDVAQEAFIKAYRALKGFRADSAFYTWLYRIAINTAKNHLIARSRRPPNTDVDIEAAEIYSAIPQMKDTDSPESNAMRDQLEACIFETLNQLPEDLRAAITLREFDGFSYEDIAEIMHCPVGTVRSRIFRAREAIDKAIAPLLKNDF